MTPIEYRAPLRWGVAGAAVVVFALVGSAAGTVSALSGSVLTALGALMVFVRVAAWVRIDDDGISMRPNGVRVFEVAWSEVIGMQGRRLRFVVDDGAGEAMVTIPPLGADPIHRIRAELEHRRIWAPAARPGGFWWPRRRE